ncbi:MAG TPA: hypothetical protein VFF73_11530 [Planctomycetota bacterium]|nr:hypothetical protein [Planctomycetota bacterium]
MLSVLSVASFGIKPCGRRHQFLRLRALVVRLADSIGDTGSVVPDSTASADDLTTLLADSSRSRVAPRGQGGDARGSSLAPSSEPDA